MTGRMKGWTLRGYRLLQENFDDPRDQGRVSYAHSEMAETILLGK